MSQWVITLWPSLGTLINWLQMTTCQGKAYHLMLILTHPLKKSSQHWVSNVERWCTSRTHRTTQSTYIYSRDRWWFSLGRSALIGFIRSHRGKWTVLMSCWGSDIDVCRWLLERLRQTRADVIIHYCVIVKISQWPSNRTNFLETRRKLKLRNIIYRRKLLLIWKNSMYTKFMKKSHLISPTQGISPGLKLPIFWIIKKTARSWQISGVVTANTWVSILTSKWSAQIEVSIWSGVLVIEANPTKPSSLIVFCSQCVPVQSTRSFRSQSCTISQQTRWGSKHSPRCTVYWR